MGKASMTDAEPPEIDSILTTETTTPAREANTRFTYPGEWKAELTEQKN